MPRAATLLVFLFLAVTAAPSQAAGPLSAQRKPWDPPSRLAGAALFPPVTLRSSDAPPSAAPAFAADDTLPAPAGGADSVRADSADTAEAPRGTKDSWTAIGLSAVLPGAGQVYTENYWKVPVILGLGGYWIYEWNRNDDKYDEYSDLYNQSIQDFPPYGDDTYLQLREAYKDQRDAFAWYLGILYLVNIVDAYVGAELYDFDVGPDLGGGGAGAYATLRIHL
jgi:hypothetical protein